jgi:lysyl-tRNA synthetase class 2
MAGGFPKTFEIGRAYRNEGSSPDHLQEFTNMEFYWAYANYEDGMKLVEEMYRYIAKTVYGKTQFSARGHTFDLADDWRRVDYITAVKEKTGIDILTATDDDMRKKLDELGVKYDGTNRERLTDTLWKYTRKLIA